MEALKAPDPLSGRKYRRQLEEMETKIRYITAKGIEGKSQKVQSCKLLHVIRDTTPLNSRSQRTE